MSGHEARGKPFGKLLCTLFCTHYAPRPTKARGLCSPASRGLRFPFDAGTAQPLLNA
jgi:hypothetical protein